jgi:apolipoprotein N-acyltransferase
MPMTFGAGRLQLFSIQVAAVVASVALCTAAFPPVALRPLAWIGLVPLLLVARGATIGTAFGLGLAWGVGAPFVLLDGVPFGVMAYFDRAAWFAWTFSAMAFTVNSALYWAGAVALYAALARRHRAVLPVLAGAAWAAAELGRSRVQDLVPPIVGTPAIPLGATQVGWDVLVQLASLTGQHGLSFLVVAVNAAIVELAVATWGGARLRSAAAGAAIVLGCLLAALGYGAVSLPKDATAAEEPPTPILVVQADLDPRTSWERETRGENLTELLRLTLSSFELIRPAVVFWPEGAMTFLVEESPPFRDTIARVLSAADTELVAGGPRLERGDRPRAYNSAFVLAPTGDVVAHYDKQHLLPFAEFVPIPGFDFLNRTFGSFRYWEPGGDFSPIPTRAGDAGVLICNESMLPSVAAQRVRAGASFLLNPANDGWLESGWTPWSHWGPLMLDAAVLRAVETRRYLVRVSTAGPSAVIDPWGRIKAVTEPGTAAVLIGGIRPRSDETPYLRLGDLFSFACVVGVGVAFARRPRGKLYGV